MKTFKQVLIILLAAGLVFAAMLPLAQTDWADGMRTTSEVSGDNAGEGDVRAEMPAALGLVLGFIKETLIMLVAGAITLGIYRLIKRSPRPKKVSQVAGLHK